MHAIRIDTTIDEAVAAALPALRPLLGSRVELIALQTEPTEPARRKLTLDELLLRRLKRPTGTPPVTLEDMERAIEQGALGDASR